MNPTLPPPPPGSRREVRPPRAAPEPFGGRDRRDRRDQPWHAPSVDQDAGEAAPTRWRWLALGLALASVSHLFLPRGFTWFLCAIPHEMGHATVGCLLGHPSAPAISLAGHAWTGIAPLQAWLVWAMALAAGAGAWSQRSHRVRCAVLAGVAIAIPAVAFTALSDLLILLGGHAGELAFAAYCYHLCMTGGHTGTAQERTAAALAGALIQTTNIKLCFGLMTDAGARAFYASNGSIGLKNDYLVIAEDLLHCRLQSVAFAMLLLALAALPAGLLIGWLRARAD